jgi:hypothetical protein
MVLLKFLSLASKPLMSSKAAPRGWKSFARLCSKNFTRLSVFSEIQALSRDYAAGNTFKGSDEGLDMLKHSGSCVPPALLAQIKCDQTVSS